MWVRLEVSSQRCEKKIGVCERSWSNIQCLGDLQPAEAVRKHKVCVFYSRTMFCFAPTSKCGLKPINQLRIDHVGSQ